MFCAVLIVSVSSFAFFVNAENVFSKVAGLPMEYDLHIVKVPGDCKHHMDYPKTGQCAETGLCLPLEAFNDGTNDCCGPKNTEKCTDLSDENLRPAGPECVKNSGRCTRGLYENGLCFQCAKNKDVCLSRLTDIRDGRCGCCPDTAPDGDCSKCEDHSDEGMLYDELHSKFYCDGKGMSMDLWNDGKQDCPATCLEPDMQEQCKSNNAKTSQISDSSLCTKFVQKGTPHCNCTSSKRCLPADAFMDGQEDCPDGEDEDPDNNPICTTEEAKKYCKYDAKDFKLCVKICNGKLFNCRYGERAYVEDVISVE